MENKEAVMLFIEMAWIAMLSLVVIVIFFSLRYSVKVLRTEKEKEKTEKEKQILVFKASVEAEENLKEKLANNLHDEIIPLLVALGRNIEQHKKDLKNNSLNESELIVDSGLTDQSIKAIRAIALDLTPSIFLNFGLIKSIEHLVMQLNSKTRSIELENKTNFSSELHLPKNIQINIYRMFSEILNNLGKHADYSYLRITIANDDKNIMVNFRHDGLGISNEEIEHFTESSAGLGLKSLKSRSLILNAKLEYNKERPSIDLTIPFY